MIQNYYENIPDLLKKCRKDMGITQKELSEHTGINLKVVRSLEQGFLTAHLGKLKELLDYLGFSMIFVELDRVELLLCV